jgi:Transposase zinc-binding domain
MTRPRPTVAEVIRICVDEFMDKYGAKLTSEQRRALEDLTACRSAALGGHVLECSECGHRQIAYNSCGNRHCPTCQATSAARWLEAHAADLLPVPYFHLVFTLPDVLDPLALANPRIVYDLLLRSHSGDTTPISDVASEVPSSGTSYLSPNSACRNGHG